MVNDTWPCACVRRWPNGDLRSIRLHLGSVERCDIAESFGGWHRTRCGTLTTNGEAQRVRPARICSACQDVLRRPETRRADCSLADGI